MKDPYLYDESSVLINKLNIKDHEKLEEAEANYVVYRLHEIAKNPLKGKYDYAHLLEMHQYIFQDLFEWAGQQRKINIEKHEAILGEMSIEYSDVFDIANDAMRVLKRLTLRHWNQMSMDDKVQAFVEDLAALWKVHCFREGNTRTIVTFLLQYIEEQGIQINRDLFEKNAQYVRTALVAYNAYFSDGNDFSKKEYLENFIRDAMTVMD